MSRATVAGYDGHMSETDASVGHRHPGYARVPAAAELNQPFDLTGLHALRQDAAAYAHRLQLTDREVARLLVVVGELSANAITHGGGAGRMRIWHTDSEVHCRVVDDGPGIDDGHAGTTPPDPTAAHGRGIWMCRQVCSDLTIGRTERGGATVTAVLDLGSPPPTDPAPVPSTASTPAPAPRDQHLDGDGGAPGPTPDPLKPESRKADGGCLPAADRPAIRRPQWMSMAYRREGGRKESTEGSARPLQSNIVMLSLGLPAPGSHPTPGIHSGSQTRKPSPRWSATPARMSRSAS